MGFLDVRVTDLEDPAATRAAQPQISGLGRYGHTVSLQMMADQGVVLLGRATSVEGDTLLVDDSLAMHLRFGDERSAEFKRNIDEYIERRRRSASPRGGSGRRATAHIGPNGTDP
jgi:putative flavoprotein involved in K+ transport